MHVKSKHGTAVHDPDIHETMLNWRDFLIALRCGLKVPVTNNGSGIWVYTSKKITCFNCLRIINNNPFLRQVKLLSGQIEG